MMSGLDRGSVVGGDFVVVRPLDEGGMGAVYVVHQTSTGKERALKVMHREIAADASLQRRFEQEAKVGARIKSEHVVDVVAAGVDPTLGVPYLIMELLEGEDLRHRLDTRGALPPDEVVAYFEQMCHALAAAHAAGIVHRDIKPENVFIARSERAGGATTTVKVLDFGIAKVSAEAGTRKTRGAVGSPLWMAPEQTQPGPITPAADVWALGLLAYTLLTGRHFWRTANEPTGTTAQLLREIVLDPIPDAMTRAREHGRADALPKGFDAWLARCLSRDPAHRYADAGAAFRAMKRMFDGTPVDVEAFAETSVAAPDGAVADRTGESAPYVPAASAPPPRLPPETPIASTRTPTPPPSPTPRASRAPLAMGIAVAFAGLSGAAWLTTRARAVDAVVAPTPLSPAASSAAQAEPSAPTPTAATSTATPPSTGTSAVPTPASEPTALGGAPSAPVAAAPSMSSSPKAPKRTIGAGFADPEGIDGARRPAMWKVQGRQIRLFTRLASNESNVADAVVKKAVEWNAWQYLRCYERVFGGAKDLPEGTVVVSFEILDQLPRHAAVESSTFANDRMADCVRGTLLGQTINAAGPDGKGRAKHAFRFVPMD